MYIKLGSINLQYYQETNDWIILGEILDSGMSYEKPILVRTTNELDIWFGKDYKDYSYMQELINMGMVLYLYRPVSEETTGDSSYIDLDEYEEREDIILRDVELNWISKVIVSPLKYKFYYNTEEVTEDDDGIRLGGFIVEGNKLVLTTTNIEERKLCTEEVVRFGLPEQISDIYESNKSGNKIKFNVYNSDDFWIYKEEENEKGELEGEFLDVGLLPQNINLTSTSTNNRDTLIISSTKSENSNNLIKFTYLDYNSVSEEFGIFQNKELIDSLENPTNNLDKIDMEDVATGYQTLMFSFYGNQLVDGDYFVFSDVSGDKDGTDSNNWKLLYYGDIENIPKDVRVMFTESGKTIKVNNFNGLINKLKRSLGYSVIKNSDEHYYVYSKTILLVTNFYSSKNIRIIPETKITEAIISRLITPAVEVVSKTIGRCSDFEDDLIKFVIEENYNYGYRITVSRYTYSEVFEGSLDVTLGEERLDNKISRQSKLVRCNFHEDTLKPGTYYLRGAVRETYTPEMYKYSLKKMLSDEYNDPTYPDYFFIPDKYKYTSDIVNENPYQLFLDYAKEVGCQFLIENKSTDELFKIVEVESLPEVKEKGTYYKVQDTYYDWEGNIVTDKFFNDVVNNGGDFVYNLIEEENRLVYFFKPMTYRYEDRPGYYAYLRGVLMNDFAISVRDILYWTPTKDAFVDEEIENKLIQYKSNYLVCDNFTYFYKDLQDGSSYITTGWTRFVLGKIFRELQKNSGELLGQQILGIVRSGISDLFTTISRNFQIVYSIGITEFEPDETGQSLKISMETIVNDQVKSNVTLDITVNYNNNIYGTIS